MDRTLHLCNQALLQAYDRSISIVYVLFVLIFSLLLAFAVLRCQLCCCCSVLLAVLFKHCSLLQSLVLQRLYLLFSTFYPLDVFVFIHFAFFCFAFARAVRFIAFVSVCFFLYGVSFMRSLTFARCLLLMNT